MEMTNHILLWIFQSLSEIESILYLMDYIMTAAIAVPNLGLVINLLTETVMGNGMLTLANNETDNRWVVSNCVETNTNIDSHWVLC